MLNQKLTMADMDTDTQDTDTDTDMPVTDTELDTTATHTADTDTIINLLLNKPSTLNHKRLFLKKSFEFVWELKLVILLVAPELQNAIVWIVLMYKENFFTNFVWKYLLFNFCFLKYIQNLKNCVIFCESFSLFDKISIDVLIVLVNQMFMKLK